MNDIIYVEFLITLLLTKYKQFGPCGFKVDISSISHFKTMAKYSHKNESALLRLKLSARPLHMGVLGDERFFIITIVYIAHGKHSVQRHPLVG